MFMFDSKIKFTRTVAGSSLSLDRNLPGVFTALRVADRKRRARGPGTRKLVCQPTFLMDSTNGLKLASDYAE